MLLVLGRAIADRLKFIFPWSVFPNAGIIIYANFRATFDNRWCCASMLRVHPTADFSFLTANRSRHRRSLGWVAPVGRPIISLWGMCSLPSGRRFFHFVTLLT